MSEIIQEGSPFIVYSDVQESTAVTLTRGPFRFGRSQRKRFARDLAWERKSYSRQAEIIRLDQSACSLTYFTTYFTARGDLVSRNRRIDKGQVRVRYTQCYSLTSSSCAAERNLWIRLASYLVSPFVSLPRNSENPDLECKAASTLDLAAGSPSAAN